MSNDKNKRKYTLAKALGMVVATVACSIAVYGGASAAFAENSTLAQLLLDKAPNHYSMEGATYSIKAGSPTGTEVGVLKTDANGNSTETLELDPGHYYAVETAAPKGFKVNNPRGNGTYAGDVEVTAGNTATFEVSDPAVHDPDLIALQKSDDNQGAHATGDAELSGAVYRLSYYDADFTTADGTNDKTPVATADFVTDASGKIRFQSPSYLKQGSDWIFKDVDGDFIWPLGTVTIQEISAPTGYLVSDTMYVANVYQKADGSVDINANWVGKFDQTADNIKSAEETPKMGSLEINKRNVETHDNGAQGDVPSLEGAEFTIYNRSANPVSYKGQIIAVGGVVDTLVTDANGHAATAEKSLEYGTYEVRETKAPFGYTLNTDFSETFQVREDGQQFSYTCENQIYRGDLNFEKRELDTQKQMSNVAWLITSKTTGESHVVVTGEDGTYNSSSELYKHSDKTNANDAAVTKNDDGTYTVDESKLDPTAGTWFYGRVNHDGMEVNDSLGAFPHDSYTITELRSKANENHQLAADQMFKIIRHNQHLELGTITNETVHIFTNAQSDAQTHTAPVTEKVTIVDHVTYSGLTVGKEYTVSGKLHLKNADGTDGGVLTDAQGNEVVASKTFVPKTKEGEYTLEFTFDSSELAGKSTVAFEEIRDSRGVVGVHADITDVDQTINFPKIGTTATNYEGDHVVPYENQVEITDTVHYDNVTVGESYTVTGTMHKQSDGSALTNADGSEVTATATFTAENTSGDVNVTFVVDTTKLEGEKLVAFETLSQADVKLVSHEDINDEAQTVAVPKIATTLTDNIDDTHQAHAVEKTTLVDHVKYENLVVGKEYTMTGRLMLDGEDSGITASTKFTPEQPNGTVDITFEFDASKYAGKKVVAFEDVTRDNHTWATHADLEDKDQTVVFPKVETEMLSTDGLHAAMPSEDMTLTDKVVVTNALDGEYEVNGILNVRSADGKDMGILMKNGMVYDLTSKKLIDLSADNTAADTDDESLAPKAEDNKIIETTENNAVEETTKSDEVTLDENGTPTDAVRGNATVTVKDGKGETSVDFKFDGSKLKGYTLVASQTVSVKDGKDIAHEGDISNDLEAVSFPDVHTTATRDGVNKTVFAGISEIRDTVEYKNLVPNREYTVNGVLHVKDADGNDAGILMKDGSIYNPDTKQIVDDTELDDEVLAPVENTSTDDAATAEESSTDTANPNDEGTTPTEDKSEIKLAEDGLPEDAVRGTTTFTPTSSDGTIDVMFAADLTKLPNRSLVAFEKLLDGKVEVANHEDIEDEKQTVFTPEIGTTLTDGKDGKEVVASDKLTLIDTVAYKNLEKGHEYVVKGQLVSKSDQSVLAESEATFTAEDTEGTTQVSFTFDASQLNGETVAFESVYEQKAQVEGETEQSSDTPQLDLVAQHNDINDASQTVKIKPVTPTTPTSPLPQLGEGYAAFILIAIAGGIAAYIVYDKKFRVARNK